MCAAKLYTCSCDLSTTKSNHLECSLIGNILGCCICECRFAWCTVRDNFRGIFFVLICRCSSPSRTMFLVGRHRHPRCGDAQYLSPFRNFVNGYTRKQESPHSNLDVRVESGVQ
jgi:hypothetical protein